ncbi:MAG: hypothetical protein ACLFU9_03115 [Candidatus Bathyarchaeia archaeon]
MVRIYTGVMKKCYLAHFRIRGAGADAYENLNLERLKAPRHKNSGAPRLVKILGTSLGKP